MAAEQWPADGEQPSEPSTSDPFRCLELLTTERAGSNLGRDALAELSASLRLEGFAAARRLFTLVRLSEPGVAGDPGPWVEAELVRRGITEWSVSAEVVAHVRADLTAECAIRLAAAEAGSLLRVVPRTARARVEEAIDLCQNLPELVSAIARGDLQVWQASIIAARSSVLDTEQRRLLASKLLAHWRRFTAKALKAVVDTMVVQADPVGAEARRREALARRKVGVSPAEDGMATFTALIPAECATLVADVLRAMSGQVATAAHDTDDVDSCTQAQREADAFVDIFQILGSGGTVSLQMSSHDQGSAAGTPEATAPATTEPGVSPFAGLTWTDIGFVRTAEPAAEDSRSAGSTSDAEAPAPADADGETEQAALAAVEQAVANVEKPTTTVGSTTADDETTAHQPPTESAPLTAPVGPAVPDARTPSGLPGFTLPTRQGRSVHVVVTISAETLAGLRDDPGLLAGHGVMTASWCRQIAEAARSFTVVAVDQRGRPVDCSPTLYRPRQTVRDRVVTLHPTCVFPDCGIASRDAELDHIVPFDHAHPDRGGPTTPENLAPLCAHHHQLKTFGGWSYRRASDGFVWISPLGSEISSPIEPLVPAVGRVDSSDIVVEPPPF